MRRKRQVRTAIHLWFVDGDPVSIHMLAYSSHEIIHRLYRNKGLTNLLYDNRKVPEKHREEYCLALKDAGNFFKHANDADRVLDFDPELSLLFLAQSIYALHQMGERETLETFCLQSYCLIHYSEVFPAELVAQVCPTDTLEKIRTIPKHQFMEAFEEGLKRAGLIDKLIR